MDLQGDKSGAGYRGFILRYRFVRERPGFRGTRQSLCFFLLKSFKTSNILVIAAVAGLVKTTEKSQNEVAYLLCF